MKILVNEIKWGGKEREKTHDTHTLTRNHTWGRESRTKMRGEGAGSGISLLQVSY